MKVSIICSLCDRSGSLPFLYWANKKRGAVSIYSGIVRIKLINRRNVFRHQEMIIDGDKLLRLPELLEKVPMTQATIYSLMGQGRFPKQVKLGGKAFWLESEIDQWIKDQINARAK